MATISFSQSSFKVVENEAVIVIDLVRSGNTTSEVVVLIGSHTHQGSAVGVFMKKISAICYYDRSSAFK